ncbi:hypothetical protein OHD60_19330 [Escherichia coli]|nr:hypothetical protein [Escherichia coli]
MLHIDTEEKNIPWWVYLFFFILASLLSYWTMYLYGGSSYLYEKSIRDVATQAILLGFISPISVRAVSVFIRNEFRIKKQNSWGYAFYIYSNASFSPWVGMGILIR